MDHESTPHVPSVGTLVRAVVYCAAFSGICVSFNYSLDMINVLLPLGVAWTLGNLLLLLLLGRHVVVKHFTPGS